MKEQFPYGLDAPYVVRNLALAATACWLLFALSFASWMPIIVDGMAWPASFFSFGALWMLWSSAYGKLREREKLLDVLRWTGQEKGLDIGCGRGLMAVGAALRAPKGNVLAADIWQQVDLSGNSPEALMINARRESVDQLIEIVTADMRALPLPDHSIDTVVSSTAIHNVYDAVGRDKAIDEIARVLKPSGQVLISDIRHLPQYMRRLRAAGFDVTLHRAAASWIWRVISFGTLAPGVLVGHKRQG
ncbi:class I SAM-dependent methyltransferase [Paraburkholderia sediminicola]|uniref:class I SAM-dependent methyltransferase n=1 Tax=Paraburkholderia sediminicola TaxID=458836 RepID=UPI0038BB6369